MNAVEIGRRSLEFLQEAVKDKGYDCTCQVGGVDALSIDTDFLEHNLDQMATAFQVMDAATDADRLTESDEFVQMTGLVELIQHYAERWAKENAWEHESFDKTFLARLILSHIDPDYVDYIADGSDD